MDSDDAEKSIRNAEFKWRSVMVILTLALLVILAQLTICLASDQVDRIQLLVHLALLCVIFRMYFCVLVWMTADPLFLHIQLLSILQALEMVQQSACCRERGGHSPVETMLQAAARLVHGGVEKPLAKTLILAMVRIHNARAKSKLHPVDSKADKLLAESGGTLI